MWGPSYTRREGKPVNILTVPTFELKSFITLSKGRATNVPARTLYGPAARCLLVDISGKRVQISHINHIWFVRRTSYDWDVSGALEGHYVLNLDMIKALDFKTHKQNISLDLDELRATFVPENYLQGIDFSILCERQKKGKHADGSTFDVGYLQTIHRYFKDAKCPEINVTYPQETYSPLQWDYESGSYQALLMPIRR